MDQRFIHVLYKLLGTMHTLPKLKCKLVQLCDIYTSTVNVKTDSIPFALHSNGKGNSAVPQHQNSI